MKLNSLDNISDKVLDKLALDYSNEDGFRITDQRKTFSHGKPRGYFLISRETYNFSSSDRLVDFTFIWINNNLWQYNYLNVNCNKIGKWEDPLELLNKLISDD